MSTPETPPEPKRRRRKRGRRSRRRLETLDRIWQDWWVEIVVAVLVLLAVFLLVEQMDIRETLFAWIVGVFDGLGDAGQGLVEGVKRFVRNTTLSDLIAYTLILVVLGLAVWRIRWRLLNSPRFTEQACPACGGDIHRIHRRTRDRLVNLFVPVRRYQCKDPDCPWHGLRVGKSRR